MRSRAVNQLIEQHYPAFLLAREAVDRPLPKYVEEQLEAHLSNTVFRASSASSVMRKRLVTFSCQRRGFCPSCGARAWRRRRAAGRRGASRTTAVPTGPVRAEVLARHRQPGTHARAHDRLSNNLRTHSEEGATHAHGWRHGRRDTDPAIWLGVASEHSLPDAVSRRRLSHAKTAAGISQQRRTELDRPLDRLSVAIGPCAGQKVFTSAHRAAAAQEGVSRKGVAQYAGFSLHSGFGVEAHARTKLERLTPTRAVNCGHRNVQGPQARILAGMVHVPKCAGLVSDQGVLRRLH
jgi:hypothetical protein